MLKGIEIRAVCPAAGDALVTLESCRVSGPSAIDSGNRITDRLVVAVGSGVRSIAQIAIVSVRPSVIEALMVPLQDNEDSADNQWAARSG